MTVATETIEAGMEIGGLVLPALQQTTSCGMPMPQVTTPRFTSTRPTRARFPDDRSRPAGHGVSLGRALMDWKPVRQLRAFSCRFTAVTVLGEIACTAAVTSQRCAVRR